MTTMTKQEAADYMKVCLSSFKKNIQSKVPAIKIGRRVLFDQKDLDAYMEAHKTVGVTE